ncbi:MAG: UDP-N-acetylglucosamine 1-carboxyvinyltransferase [Candidatus Ozemobacter sibiricus]|jgi:UDP-N-acetylglucosamine 1-carboxyvinyltransferase|uniref:UDP-N-acetylglucosamine 1-carboxyvinyltransferase n=1 Tax=Candidatus Ozemobacter sibiricus TaxID=2268124 RepID=A0A367ZKX7_9BACT|nr:MAG: UDP-N-acetylglucosamine 1-carboxyvinyltransferase [Candidatus Ozemobacter sibiricus]
MARILIEGGIPLSGEIAVGGAKNAALPIMAATLLCGDPIRLSNVPRLNDVETMQKVLRALGGTVAWEGPHEMAITCDGGIKEEAPYELVKAMRASFFVMGPLLARLRRARVPLPGGCAIGVRPVNIHLKGFEALGAKVSIDGGFAVATADRLQGARIHLDFPSVGATENLMMAATLAEGTTVIENAAQEPEIVDLADFLNAMGAKVQGAGGPTIQIEGVRQLRGVSYRVIPDRIDAGTFLVLGAMTRGPLVIKDAQPAHQMAVIAKLQEMGATIDVQGDRMTVEARGRLRGVDVKTLPYPGFPTDMQAQITVAMCLAQGTSLVTETVFENRFMHIAELVRMGANLNIRDRTVVINGVDRLIGCPVSASDLRAGAALVMAGLVAEGRTEVGNVFHIDRGYENLVERLARLGARISRLEEPATPPDHSRR